MSEGPLTQEEMDAIQARFPERFVAKHGSKVHLRDLIIDYGPLTEEHIAAAEAHVEAGTVLGVPRTAATVQLRHTHHRLAQLIAGGMDEGRAGILCNYTPAYVSSLKHNPAFDDLLAFYKSQVDAAFTDFTTAAADLSMDMLDRLRQVLEESPERLTPMDLRESIKLLADRSGNAPVTKTHNINVNLGMGDRLRAARERANSAIIEGQSRLTGTDG